MSSDWPVVRLSEVCDSIVDCVNKTAPVVDYVTPYLMIRTTNVKKGVINLKGARYVTEETFNKWTRRVTPKVGDVVLTREAPLGDVGMITTPEKKIFLGQRLMQYRVNKEKLDPFFLLYSLQGNDLQGQLKAAGSGSTVEHIRVGDAENLKIKLPDLCTQKTIGIILSNYDSLIENNNRRIAILEDMAQSLYREWFVKFRFPDHENVKFKDSPLGQIPEGWEVKKLKEACKLTMGQSPKSEFYNEEKNGAPFFQGVRDFGLRFPSVRVWCSKPTRLACKNDILFSVRAPVGRLNIAGFEMAIGRGLCAIRHKDNFQSFLYQQLKAIFTSEDMMGNGAIFNSVTKADMEGINLLSPNLDVLKLAEVQLKSIFRNLDLLCSKNENLKKQRDMLLPKLISGKINLKD
jgi:type I restriction enzyme S subunit